MLSCLPLIGWELEVVEVVNCELTVAYLEGINEDHSLNLAINSIKLETSLITIFYKEASD